jgi:hypothetical protein
MTGRPVVPLFLGANMENEQKIANDGAQTGPGVVGHHDTVAAAHPVKGSASDGASVIRRFRIFSAYSCSGPLCARIQQGQGFDNCLLIPV